MYILPWYKIRSINAHMKSTSFQRNFSLHDLMENLTRDENLIWQVEMGLKVYNSLWCRLLTGLWDIICMNGFFWSLRQVWIVSSRNIDWRRSLYKRHDSRKKCWRFEFSMRKRWRQWWVLRGDESVGREIRGRDDIASHIDWKGDWKGFDRLWLCCLL